VAGQRLGQHFLHSQAVQERIARAACPSPDLTVVEIGPGKGALTRHLATLAAKLIAIELDAKLAAYLRQQLFAESPTFTLIEADVLSVDLSQWGPITVAGNLPYYITSPIIAKVLRLGSLLQQAVFLVQKEVAERLTAKPGTRDYGYLSVQTQALSQAEYLFTVAPGSFKPPPKVESAVVRLTPKPASVADPDRFLKFAGRCFQQKRKMLRNNLLPFYDRDRIEALPEGNLRAEQLSVPDLIRLYETLELR
jgi:16S rRNA (adenine1518-N6/adenine1519-N6)-dimethyltransferase